MYHLFQLFVTWPAVFLSSVWAGTTMSVMCPLMRMVMPKQCSEGERVSKAVRYSDWWGNFAARWWARIIIRTSLLPVEVRGREHLLKDEVCLYVANHQGAYDILLVCGYLNMPFRWMMKRALQKVPFLGWGCTHAGYVYVDNKNPGEVRRTYRNAEEVLRNGSSLAVFPEGSRSKNGELGSFKDGAFMLADKLQIPVIPLTINGSYDVMPRTSKGIFIKHHKLTLTIHRAIYPISQGEENQAATREEAYRLIESAL